MIQSLMNPEVNSTEKSNAECRRLTREVDMWKSRVGKLTVQVSELQMQATKQSLSTASRELDSRLQEVEGMNEQLRVEMDDIKYNYRQTLKQCIEYEDGIKRLCRVTGDRVSDFIKGSPSSRSSS